MKGAYRKLSWFIVIVLALAAAVGVSLALYSNKLAASQSQSQSQTTPAISEPSKVASLGRIEPRDGVFRIAARSLSGQPSIVSELRVREGERVKAGQLLALLDSRRQFEAAVRDLDARVPVAQSRLATVSAGAKEADLAVQQAEIARLEVELANARTELNRYHTLYDAGAATVVERDRRRTAVDTTTEILNQARSRLASLQDVRDVDIKLAEAEVQSARATVERAKAEVRASEVRAPIDGQVLRIHAYPGEDIGPQGLLEIGRTDEMYVVAEVFESDIGRVRIGDKASITGESLKQPLHGEVESIALQVAKNNILQTDPASLTDARVIEVKIRLDDSTTASRLIHAKVTVVIGN